MFIQARSLAAWSTLLGVYLASRVSGGDIYQEDSPGHGVGGGDARPGLGHAPCSCPAHRAGGAAPPGRHRRHWPRAYVRLDRGPVAVLVLAVNLGTEIMESQNTTASME